VTDGRDTKVLTAYRTPERILEAPCPLCEQLRPLVFDLTIGRDAAEFETLSACADCAPRAARLLRWLGGGA
jgi:hypothetical protein